MPVRKNPDKKTRAARGTGSVFFSKRRGLWVARKPVGRKGANTVYLTRTGATQAEAIRRRDAAAPPTPGDRLTLAAWLPRWLESLDVKEQSRDGYRACVTLRIAPTLGHLRVADLTAFHVEEAVRKWGRQVAAGTVRRTLAALSACLQAAERAELRAGNPARAVRRPRPAEPKLDLFDGPEVGRIVAAALADPKTHFVAVLAATGARVGESLATKPGDYDPTTGLWTVRGTLTREHGVGTPKSRNSARTVRVPAAARPAWANWSPPKSYTVARQRWLKLLRGLGLRARGLHQLRHTCASHSLAAGVPLANVARDLGDSVDTLVKVYLHPVPGRGVADAMDELLRCPEGVQERAKARNSGRKRGTN